MSWYGSHPFLIDCIVKKKCRRIMEIGVYNGDNAKKMVETAIHNYPPSEIEYYGFDYFQGYSASYVGKKLEKTECRFRLFEGDTIDTLPKAIGSLPKMDLIFIDGGKSYTEAKSDWENSKTLIHDETTVFVHNLEFSGIHRMVDSIPRDKYKVNIIQSHSEGTIALVEKIS